MNLVYLSFAPALLAPGLGSRIVRGSAPLALLALAALQAAAALAVTFQVTTTTRLAAGFLTTDATARLFLVVINLIFLGIAAYVWNRARTEAQLAGVVSRFARLSLVFMGAANFVVLSNHLVAGWIALEITTLAAAPLVVRADAPASRRASWRYFLFSTVGLAIALVGLSCLARGMVADGEHATFFLDELRNLSIGSANPWNRIGLALVVLGYGTKLGLAPMYSWLPESLDEAPHSTTALLESVEFICDFV
jgi:hydrogenase-4 component F